MVQSENDLQVKIERQLRFETLLSGISAHFINLPANRIDGAIEDAQRRICECLGLDLSSLWQWSNDSPRQLALTHLHTPPNGPKRPDYIDGEESFPWVYSRIQRGETVAFSTEQLPPEAHRDRDAHQYFGIKSALAIPLAAGGQPILGVLTFNTLWKEHPWPEDIIKRLQLVAEIFANALARRQAEENLRKSEERYESFRRQLEDENYCLRADLRSEQGFERIIGKSKELQTVLMAARQVASTDATVLILGETGTGKGLFADAIHRMSPRKNHPFVTVNCAALPHNLIESELFGREKGAFTGSHAKQAGRFEIADRGTIFLDEIGEMPLELQAKLLRVLQEGEFERLGSARTLKVNVRVIAATGRNLRDEVLQGRFREDLFYRLNVFPITIPPLRQRTEDIPLLAQHFVGKFARKMGKRIDSINRKVLNRMLFHSWPGNVRELEHLIERGVIISPGSSLALDDQPTPSIPNPGPNPGHDLASIERGHIIRVLRQTDWKIEGPGGAASVLDLHPSTLRFRLKKLGIRRPV